MWQIAVSVRQTWRKKELVTCHWTFEDSSTPHLQGIKRLFSKFRPQPKTQQFENLLLPEDGWYVHHYFEKDVVTSKVSVKFYKSDGTLITLAQGENWPALLVKPQRSRRSEENWQRFSLELTQLGAALLIPLATLASTTVSGGSSGHWWELVAIGFGSDTIKNILVGKEDSQSPAQRATK